MQGWTQVPLEDLALEDTTLQFRLKTTLDALVDSLQLQGQREPVDLMGSRRPFRIVDGFQRVEAARRLGWVSIKAFVHNALSESDAWRLAFTKNVVRRNLSQIERANAILLARKQGVTTTELAGVFGLSARQVQRYLAFLDLPHAILEVCDGRVITMEHARVLQRANVTDPAHWAEVIKRERLDSHCLAKRLRDQTRRPRGRPRSYVQIGEDYIRVYAFKLSLAATTQEKSRVLSALNQVINKLAANDSQAT